MPVWALIKGTIVSHLCDTTGQVFVPLESLRVPVELIVPHPCAWHNVAAISRADEVSAGIYSLGFSWNQPAGAEGDRKGLVRADSAGTALSFLLETQRAGGTVRSRGRFQKDGPAGGAMAGRGYCRFSSWVNLYLEQASQSVVSLCFF